MDHFGWLDAIPFHQQILNHMNESAVYNEADLVPFRRRLAELREIVRKDAEENKHPKALVKLLERQMNECGAYLPNQRQRPLSNLH